jgi:hypothetical protein
VRFNESFLSESRNILGELVPEYSGLEDVIRVIDVPQVADGQVVCLAMNAEADAAVAYFTTERGRSEVEETGWERPPLQSGEHWRWRMRVAEKIAAEMDPGVFGVEAMYVIGSTKNATATAASDIDLLVHFRGSEAQKRELLCWLDGWSVSLTEMNYMRTGIRTERILDIHIVTDRDIERKSSYAVKIGAVTDAARPLALRR